MATYPADLQYVVSAMPGWSVNTTRLIPVSLQSVLPGNYLTINLPENTLVDLKSLVVMGDAVASIQQGTTSGNKQQAVFPTGTWSLIDQISVSINGTTIDASCSAYNHLHKLMWDMEKGNRQFAEEVLEWTYPRTTVVNGSANINLPAIGQSALLTGSVSTAPPSTVSVTANSSYWAGSSQNAWPFILKDFLGFLGNGKIVDTSTLGLVQIQFRFAPNDIMMNGSTTDGAAAYGVQNLRAFVNVCDVSDGIYYAALSERLQTAPLQIPFKHYISVFAPQLDGTGSVRFSVNSRSIDAVYALLRPALWTTTATASSSGVPAPYETPINGYFARKLSNKGYPTGGTGTPLATAGKWIRTTQMSLNAVNYPMFAPNPDEQYWLALNAFRQFNEEALAPTFDMDYAHWHDTLGFFAYRFSHNKDLNYTSGVNTQGLNANFSVDFVVDGTGSDGLNALPVIIVECNSVLNVGAYRSLSLTV